MTNEQKAQQFYESWRQKPENVSDPRGDWPIRMLADYMRQQAVGMQGLPLWGTRGGRA